MRCALAGSVHRLVGRAGWILPTPASAEAAADLIYQIIGCFPLAVGSMLDWPGLHLRAGISFAHTGVTCHKMKKVKPQRDSRLERSTSSSRRRLLGGVRREVSVKCCSCQMKSNLPVLCLKTRRVKDTCTSASCISKGMLINYRWAVVAASIMLPQATWHRSLLSFF